MLAANAGPRLPTCLQEPSVKTSCEDARTHVGLQTATPHSDVQSFTQGDDSSQIPISGPVLRRACIPSKAWQCQNWAGRLSRCASGSPDNMAALGITPIDVRNALFRQLRDRRRTVTADFVQTSINAATCSTPGRVGPWLSLGGDAERLTDIAGVELGRRAWIRLRVLRLKAGSSSCRHAYRPLDVAAR